MRRCGRGAPVPLVLLLACAAAGNEPASTLASGPAPAPTVRAEYHGTIELEGHLAEPGDTVPVALTWAQTCARARCLVERSTGTGDDAHTTRIWSTPEATWAEGDANRWSDEAAAHHRRLLELFAPEGEPPRAIRRFAHARLGTVTDTASYASYVDGVPEDVTLAVHEGDVAWRGALSLRDAEPRDGLDVPQPPPPAEPAPPSIERIADRLWDVRVPAHDARSFVIEFDDFAVVVEAPWSSAVGEQIVDLIVGELPDAPIRYVLYSHHHPHYTGGLRAFAAAGASVVAPGAHAEFIRGIAALDFSLQPDRFADEGAEMSLDTYDGTFTIAAGGRSVRVIDIGARSNHTAVYNVFWLPGSATLIQGDIGWLMAPDGRLRVGERSVGLLRAIEADELPVRTLLQSWPVSTQAPSLTMEAFRTAVQGDGG